MIISDLFLNSKMSVGDEELDPPLVVEARHWVDTDAVDHERVKHILRQLLQQPKLSVKMLHSAGIIAVIADDREAWSHVQDLLGSKADPALGVLSYLRLKLATKDPAKRRAWFHIVEYAAHSGSIDARIAVAKAREPKNSILRSLYWGWMKIRIALKVAILTARNPSDPRLFLGNRNKAAIKIFEYI